MIISSLQKTVAGVALTTILTMAYPAHAWDGVAADIKKGAEIYAGTCIACHGKNGKGEDIPGVPDFTSPKGPLSKPDSVLFDHILNGFQSPGSDFEMPELGGNEDMTEQDIINVMAYLRVKFQSRK